MVLGIGGSGRATLGRRGKTFLNRLNVAYGLLTVGGVLTVLNIKTNALKCSTAGIFLTKGITQHFPRYIHCRTTADSAGGSSRCC